VESVCPQHGVPTTARTPRAFQRRVLRALKPASQWPKTSTTRTISLQVLADLQKKFPGVEFNFSQYLQDNVAEAVSGVKGENSIKLYGNDLEALTRTANQIKAVLSTVKGVTDLSVFTSLGQPTIQIDIDRARAARYGLSPGDINSTIRVAIGGDSAGDLYEPGSDRHFPISSLHGIRKSGGDSQFAIGARGRRYHPDSLMRVATIRLVSGAAYIYREQQGALPADQVLGARTHLGARQGRAGQVAARCNAARSRSSEVGEFGKCRMRSGGCRCVVPISSAIAMQLWFNSARGRHAVAMSGSDGGVRRRGRLFSAASRSASRRRSASSPVGIACGRHHILSQYKQLIDEGMDRSRRGSAPRNADAPVLMTCAVAGIGLLPAALSTISARSPSRAVVVVRQALARW